MTITHTTLLADLAATRAHDAELAAGATPCTNDASHVAASVLLRGGVPVCAPCWLDTPRSKR